MTIIVSAGVHADRHASGAADPEDPYFVPRGPGTASTAAAVPFANLKDFGASVGTGGDDTTAIQDFLDACVANGHLGVVPPGEYLHTGLTVTGSIRLLGLGVAEAYTGGTNHDAALPGPKFRCTANSGDGLLVSAASNTRNHVVMDGITWIGNSSATSGAGVRFYANATTSAIIYDLERCNFIGAKGDGLTMEGNCFESRLAAVQCNQNGGTGLVIKGSGGGGIPGETLLSRVTCDLNGARGFDVSGGGDFTFTQLTASNNTTEGGKFSGVKVQGVGLHGEVNAGTSQFIFDSMTAPQVSGVSINWGALTSGTGLKLTSVLWGRFSGSTSNASGSILDWTTDGGCGECEISFTSSGGFSSTRYTDGSYLTKVNRGGNNFSPYHPSTLYVSPASGNVTPDSRKYDTVIYEVTAGGASIAIQTPTMSIAASTQTGQQLRVGVFNNSGGALGSVTTSSGFKLVSGGAFTLPAPANGKWRFYDFIYVNSISKWVEISAETGDVG